jgi:hypothetical protein
MRRRPGGVNRFWLIIIGLLLLLSGLIGIGIGTGLLQQVLDRFAVGVQLPDRSARVFGDLDLIQFTQPGPQTVLVGVAGAIVLLVGLAWIIRQLPRPSRQLDYRLHDDARTGVVTLHPKVMAEALAERVRALPGVTGATGTMSGTADHPVVRMMIKADAHADLPEVLRRSYDRIAEDLDVALGAGVERIAVQLDITPRAALEHQVVL